MIRVVAGGGRAGPLRIIADGVRLNPGLPDEPHPATLIALGRALDALARGKGAQELWLRRAALTLVLHQEGEEAVLRWVRTGKPHAAIVRSARLELLGLVRATAQALEAAPGATRLQRGLWRREVPPRELALHPGFTVERSAGELTVRVEVDAVPAAEGTPWLALLAPGRLALLHRGRALAGERQAPFLALMDLARFSERAVKLGGREPLTLAEGGALSVEGDTVRVGRNALAELRVPMAVAVAETAEAVAQVLARARPALANAAPLKELRARVAAIQQRTRTRPVAARRHAPSPADLPPPRPARPLTTGTLRRAHFEPLFQARLGFAVERLRLLDTVVLAEGEGQVAAVGLDGRIAWTRRLEAASFESILLGVDPLGLLWRVEPVTGRARWFRDGEGAAPRALHPLGAGLVLLEEPDALSARCTETGLATWTFKLPAGDRLGVAVTADRIFLCSSGGLLAALDPATGEPHFRAMAPKPFRRAPLLFGGGLFALMEDAQGDALLHVDARTAQVRWMGQLQLRETGALQALGSAVAVVGRGGEGFCLAMFDIRAGTGSLLPLPFGGHAPPAVCATPDGLIIASADGQALRATSQLTMPLELEGGRPTQRPVAPVRARELVLLASETPALHDAVTGRRVATLPTMEGLTATAADEALRVVVADDGGLVRGYRLAGHLSVPPPPPPPLP